jgi:hypothetical protein
MGSYEKKFFFVWLRFVYIERWHCFRFLIVLKADFFYGFIEILYIETKSLISWF